MRQQPFVRILATWRRAKSPHVTEIRNAPTAVLAAIEQQMHDAHKSAARMRRILLRVGFGLYCLTPASLASPVLLPAAVVAASLCGTQLLSMPEAIRTERVAHAFVETVVDCGRVSELSALIVRWYLLTEGNLGMLLARAYGLCAVTQGFLHYAADFPAFEIMWCPGAVGLWMAAAAGSLAMFPGQVRRRAQEHGLLTPSLNTKIAEFGTTFAALGAGMAVLAKIYLQ